MNNKTVNILITFTMLSFCALIITFITGNDYKLNFATVAAMYAVIQNI